MGGLSPTTPASFISWEGWGHSKSFLLPSLNSLENCSSSESQIFLCSLQLYVLACIHFKSSISPLAEGGGGERPTACFHAFPLSFPSLSLCVCVWAWLLALLQVARPLLSACVVRRFRPSHFWHSDKASSAAAARTQLNYSAWSRTAAPWAPKFACNPTAWHRELPWFPEWN